MPASATPARCAPPCAESSARMTDSPRQANLTRGSRRCAAVPAWAACASRAPWRRAARRRYRACGGPACTPPSRPCPCLDAFVAGMGLAVDLAQQERTAPASMTKEPLEASTISAHGPTARICSPAIATTPSEITRRPAGMVTTTVLPRDERQLSRTLSAIGRGAGASAEP